MLIDTHSHINVDKMSDILPEIIANLDTGAVNRVICPSFSLESSVTALGLAESQPKVFCALGVHPENCLEYNADCEAFLVRNAGQDKVVAIGEIGLDYHYGIDNIEAQFVALNKQIDIARRFDLPVIFHIRDAFDDFFDWLEDNRHRFGRGVVHCFEGDRATAERLLSFDLMLSFTGLVTFKPRADIREAVAIVPMDKFMVETDAPYLAPEPYRGQINRPEYTELVARKIAEIKGVSLAEVAAASTQNAYKFFDKMREFDERNK